MDGGSSTEEQSSTAGGVLRRLGKSPLAGKTRNVGEQAPPSSFTEAAPDLNARLQEAQQAEQPLAAEVGRLEAALAAALEERDYLAAEDAKNALPPARQALAIASATASALQQACTAVEEQRQADELAVQRARGEDQASRDLQAATEREREAARERDRHLAAVDAGLGAVRESYRLALVAEGLALNARGAVEAAEIALGRRELSRYNFRSNAVEGRLEHDPVLSAVIRGIR